VTVAALLARGQVRQIARTECDGMGVSVVTPAKPAIVTGCAVAADRQRLTDRNADRSAVDIVTAATGVVNLHICPIGQWRRIAVTGTTTGAGRTGANHGHQRGVIQVIGGMGHFPAALMTGRTVAAGREGLT